MCLILFSFDPESETPLVLGANRDEFFNRATAAAAHWDDMPQILAGRDLVCGGTWLGVTTSGRFAAVTNVREPLAKGKKLRSRGDLTREFLSSDIPAATFLKQIQDHADDYSGFNLLVGEFGEKPVLYYMSNRAPGIRQLTTGIYGLSNHLLDSPWPKVEAGKKTLEQLLLEGAAETQGIRHMLENPDVADDADLPDTGIAYEREKALSAAFITLGDYGTRASTTLVIDRQQIRFSEQNYEPSTDGSVNKSAAVREFTISNAS